VQRGETFEDFVAAIGDGEARAETDRRTAAEASRNSRTRKAAQGSSRGRASERDLDDIALEVAVADRENAAVLRPDLRVALDPALDFVPVLSLLGLAGWTFLVIVVAFIRPPRIR
jgi:hypothetical protein